MTFEIDGLDSVETRKQAEDALLGVTGTISFTFDMVNGKDMLIVYLPLSSVC